MKAIDLFDEIVAEAAELVASALAARSSDDPLVRAGGMGDALKSIALSDFAKRLGRTDEVLQALAERSPGEFP